MRIRTGGAAFLLMAGLAGGTTVHRAAAPLVITGVAPTQVTESKRASAIVSGDGFIAETQFTLIGSAAFFVGSTPAGSPTFRENDILIRDGLAFVVQFDLRIFSLTDAAAPQQIGLLNRSGAALALSGNVLSVASGNTLASVDVSIPAAPRVLATGKTSEFCRVAGAAALGTTVYVACGRTGGVHIWDGTTFVQHFDTAGPGSQFTGDVAIQDGLAFVTDETSGLVVLDLVDPLHPTIAGRLDDGLLAGRTVTLAGDIAWVGGSNAVAAVDISDPTAPVLRGQAPIWGEAIAISEENGFVHAMDIRNGPHVYDGRDPDAPRLLYQMQSDTFTVGFGYAVSDGMAYAVNSFFGTLDVFDVTRPVPPGLSGGAALFARSRVGLVATHRLLHATSATELLLFDISTPADLAVAGSVPLADFPGQIVNRGHLDFVLLNNGFAIVDTHDAAHPGVIGTFVSSFPDRIAVSGNRVFVGGRDAIRVVDASRPSAPVEIAAVPFAADVFDMAADRGILAVASGDDMLRLYDVSVPQNPILVHSRSMTAFSLAFQSHHLLAGGAGGLQVLDVQNPAAPVESGSLGAPLTVFNIDLERDLALLSGRVGTFGDLAGQFVVDVNDPTRPRLAGGNAQLFGATTSSRGMSYGNFSAGALNAWRINPLTTSHVLSSTDALVEIPKRMNPGFYDVLAVSPGGQFHIMRQAVEVVRSSARGNSGHR